MDLSQGVALGAGLGMNAAMAKQSYQFAEAAVDQGGLARIADQVTQAAIQVDQIASMLQGISVGIHGPRPEPVGNSQADSAPHADSLSSRVQNLLASIERLQRSYESIVR